VLLKTRCRHSIYNPAIEELSCNHDYLCTSAERQWSIAARKSDNIFDALKYSDMPFEAGEYWNINLPNLNRFWSLCASSVPAKALFFNHVVSRLGRICRQKAAKLTIADHFLTTAARRFNLAFTAWAFSDLHIYTIV